MSTTARPERVFCSGFSRSQDEDMIGAAWPWHAAHLLIETPLPWASEFIDSRTLPAGLRSVIERAEEQDRRVEVLGIVPDPEYSRPSYTRVIHLRRPRQPFTVFDRAEYLVPSEDAVDLVSCLLEQSDRPGAFDQYLQSGPAPRDLLVCTHGSQDACCGKFGFPIYRLLREVHASAAAQQTRVWRVSHFGGHRFAPTLIDFPEGRYWGRLDPELLSALVHRTGDAVDLRPYYRGWSGLGYYEQVVEREIFAREGWAWTTCNVQGRTAGAGDEEDAYPVFDEEPAKDVTVHLSYSSPDGRRSGTYEARVSWVRTVETQGECGFEPLLAHQFQVSHLRHSSADD